MTYKKWFRKNEDKLIEDYEDYFENLDKEIFVPLDFEDYAYNIYEESENNYVEKEDR